ncbi:uncharacterized protein LOC144446677 [Glandiceps talaboti]
MAEGGAPSNKLINDIDEQILLCPICIDRFKSPKILPCFHTFCEHCLTDWVKTNKGNLVCPTCKQTWPLPSGGATKVGNNCFMNDLLEIITKFNESTKSKCEICEKDANYWCKDCGQYFCDDCIRAHKVVKALQEHQFMTVEEYNTKMRSKHFRLLQPRFCDIHPTTPVEFYCDVCQVPACLKCNVTEHTAPDHKMITLEKAFEKYSPTLNQYQKKLEQEIGAYKDAKERAENVGKNLDGNKVETEKQVKDAVEKMEKEARAETDRLLGEVDKLYKPKRDAINSEIDHLSLSLASVESVHSYLTNLLMYGGPVDIMAAKKELDRQVEEKAKKKRKDPKLTSDVIFQENVDYIPVHLGTIMSEKSPIKDVRKSVGKLFRENQGAGSAAAKESIYDQVAATIDVSRLAMSEDEARTKIDAAAQKAGILHYNKGDGKTVILQGRLEHINLVNRQVLGLKTSEYGVQDKGLLHRVSPRSSPRSSVVKLNVRHETSPSPGKSSVDEGEIGGARAFQGPISMTATPTVRRTSTSRVVATSVSIGDLSASSGTRCKICLEEIKHARELPCKHKFCKKCMDKCEKQSGKRCPVCIEAFGTLTGNMPNGTMKDSVEASSLPGYPSCGTIIISYNFPSGKQGKEHPNPGKPYTGTQRTAFLPDNAEGREVLRLLKIAFQRRLTFTIDTSRMTGTTDTVVWNDIRHKTNKHSGAQEYGYPDPGYLDRVKDELAVKGVK